MRKKEKVAGFPVWVIFLTNILTVSALGVFGWGAVTHYQDMKELNLTVSHLGMLGGEILLLDEILTMSTRMAIATGDSKWIIRYRTNEKVLDQTIQEAFSFSILNQQAMVGVENANDILVSLEHTAFRLIENNQREQAGRLLSSTVYIENKNKYSNGIATIFKDIDQRSYKLIAETNKQVQAAIIGSFFLLIIIVPVLTVSAWRIHSWHVSLVKNIDLRYKAEKELVSKEKLYKSELNLAEAQRMVHLGNWELDLETDELLWSDELFRIFEVSQDTPSSELFAIFFDQMHPEDKDLVHQIYSMSLMDLSPRSVEYRLVMPGDHKIKYVESSFNTMIDLVGIPTKAIGTVQDITEKRVAQLQLFTEEKRAAVTLNSIGDAVIATDPEGIIEFLNPVAEELTGWKSTEAVGQPLHEVFYIINEDSRELELNPVTRCLTEGKVVGLANHTVLISRTGNEYAIEDSAAPILGRLGEILGVVLVFKDVTAARKLSHQVSHQATHDALTDLINRVEFERRLSRVMETAQFEHTENALCFLDLDRFKLVNDTSGHVAGDELLRQIGQLLQQHIRKRDTLARLGGDEFGLLIEHCSMYEAQKVANNVVKAISEFCFPWEGRSFTIGVSIGLVSVNKSSKSITSVMSDADNACYMAKEKGGKQVHVYEDEDEELLKRSGEMQWAVRLPTAIEKDRFKLYYQDIVPLDTFENFGTHYEILLRLLDKNGDLVLPDVFLPAAERYHLTDKIDRWVIRETFKWLSNNPEHLGMLDTCSINLSGLSIGNKTFGLTIMRELEEYNIPPEKICFEITETVAIANLTNAKELIGTLRDVGCKFALDDFGSGLSSFAYLKNLPVEYLKIDGFFVKDIVTDPMTCAMVRSINDIGHVMSKKTVAEFVENEETMNKLRDIGIDFVQGNLVGEPRPITQKLVT